MAAFKHEDAHFRSKVFIFVCTHSSRVSYGQMAILRYFYGLAWLKQDSMLQGSLFFVTWPERSHKTSVGRIIFQFDG